MEPEADFQKGKLSFRAVWHLSGEFISRAVGVVGGGRGLHYRGGGIQSETVWNAFQMH